MTGTEWYMTKKGLDVLKFVCTRGHAQWLMRLYNKYLVKPAEHFDGYKMQAQDNLGIEHGRGRVPGSSTQLASSVIVHFLRPFGSKRHSRALRRREKEPKRHHPPKALPQGRDATAPPVALLNRYARTIKGPAYILFFGAIYTMLKHQGASRTAGDAHGRGI